MSDLSLQLQQAHSQLPVTSYFDEALFQRELETIFQQGPRYVGHQLAVPNVGDYYALPHEGEGRALVRSANGVELVSNVCRHRQAVMLKGRGSLNNQAPGSAGGNIVCPLHRWTYDLNGQLLGAPHFQQQPCSHLKSYDLQNWRGLLFNSAQNIQQQLAQVPFLEEFDFSGYLLDSVKVHTVDYNWKTFIEVYLEDYHVEPFHPGLGQFVECANLQWHYGENWSVQSVGLNAGLRRPGTPVYKRWHEAVTRFSNGVEPKHGAIWFAMYPNLMVEWYPHVLVVASLHPQGPQKTLIATEYYYPEEITLFEREFVQAEQAAYDETAVEDDEIALRMDHGRKILMERGEDDAGPYQTPMEDGMVHFHKWYANAMKKGHQLNTAVVSKKII